MKKIAKLEQKLAAMRAELNTCVDPDRRAELEESIDYYQDEVDELEEAIADEQSYEEATGTTPQDLYNDRNAYAIRQGELVEQFRNEK